MIDMISARTLSLNRGESPRFEVRTLANTLLYLGKFYGGLKMKKFEVRRPACDHSTPRQLVKKLPLLAPVVFTLSACGGDSGGVNSTPTPAPTPTTPASFSSFSGVQAGASTSISGMTREGSVTISPTGAILQNDVATPTEASGSAQFTLNSSRQITSLSITGAQSNVSFNASNSTSSSLYLNNQPVATAVYNGSGSNQALFGDPYVLGFDYQTFGVWGTGLVTGGSGKFGAFSVGSKTSASAIPTTGSVTYRGYAGGIYTEGAISRYAADATFSVDFANRTIGFATTNQTLTDVLTNITSATSMLRLSGTLSYAAGSNGFSGNLSANGRTSLLPLNGTASGAFYGPTASEIGGTFFLRGSTTTLVGGFGGKRQ